MFSDSDRLCVGLKQSRKAILEDNAKKVFVALDADDFIKDEIRALSEKKNIPLNVENTMKQLGEECNIEVGAAVVVVLK